MLSKSPWRRNTNRDDDGSSLVEAARTSSSQNSLANEKSRVSRACERLKNIFSVRSSSHEKQSEIISEDTECSRSRNQTLARSTSATALVTEYIRSVARTDVSKRNFSSNTPTSVVRQPSEPRIFLVGQGSSRERHALLEKCRACRVELVGVAYLLVELKKHLSDAPWSDGPETDQTCKSTCETGEEVSVLFDKSKRERGGSPIRACDKGVQCSVDSDFLKVLPNLKFFSRSSLVINVDQQQQQQQQQPEIQVLQHPKRLSTRARGKLLPSPSLEYVASYRPEFGRPVNAERLSGLRSFSSSAIFGLEPGGDSSGRLRATYAPRARNRISQSSRHQRSRRNARTSRTTFNNNIGGGGGDEDLHLREALNRTEDELLRYSSFIEDDLVSIPRPRTQPSTTTPRPSSRWSSLHRPPKRRPQTRPSSVDRLLPGEDVLAVKKILLEDYITEVREIVRSGQHYSIENRSSEAAILESVRRRMEEDSGSRSDGQPMSDESWHSLKSLKHQQQRPSTSGATSATYVTAKNCCSSYSCCSCCCGCYCCGLARVGGEVRGWTPPQDSGDFCRHAAVERLRRGAHKTCDCEADDRRRSVDSCCDSYVEAEASSRLVNSESESKAKTSRSVDSGVQLDYSRGASSLRSSDELAKLGGRRRHCSAATTTGDESSGCSDEMLCQRVESAVRKFTEKLILCERRTNDRSSSTVATRRRPARRKSYTLTDENSYSALNHLRNSRCSSEDELITEISTPSLVSLTDSDNPTSLDVSYS